MYTNGMYEVELKWRRLRIDWWKVMTQKEVQRKIFRRCEKIGGDGNGSFSFAPF